MRLLEFRASNILMRDLIDALSHYFDMERVGGDSRVYKVGSRSGVIFMLNNSLRALGLIYSRDGGRVEAVAVWHKINLDGEPDFVVDIPADANLVDIIDPLVKFIKQPRQGLIEGIIMEARNIAPVEFFDLARKFYGEKAKRLSINDLNKLADRFDVLVPPAVRHNPLLKDGEYWNLYDDLDPHAAVAKHLGTKVGEADPNDPHYQQLVHLSKVGSLNGMQRSGSLVIMGRKPNGEVFEIPGIDDVTAQLDRLLARFTHHDIAGDERSSMERQYSELEKKIEMIAGGTSEFIKSLLIVGAPSSGKTFRTMKVINEMGLKAGEDYVTKKGKISAKSLYRVLIQQLHGLAVFDDCDSVVKDPNGVNMLKGALDTDPIRTVDYDVDGLMNTDAMSFEQRGKIVHAMSAILRGVPTETELAIIEDLMGAKADARAKAKGQKKEQPAENNRHPASDVWDLSAGWNDVIADEKDDEPGDDARVTDKVRIREAEAFVMNNLPNKIDFYGRVIFISNMSVEEWQEVGDGAILTRAFSQNLSFPDNEMLDFIDKIKENIKTPRLSEEDKTEVLAYLRELWVAGKVNKPVNFRLVQSSFDLFLLNDWKALVAANCE